MQKAFLWGHFSGLAAKKNEFLASIKTSLNSLILDLLGSFPPQFLNLKYTRQRTHTQQILYHQYRFTTVYYTAEAAYRANVITEAP